ncbi:STAS domain-containing protein [Nocardioides sp. SYSU DS0663]|uniref:STAS domain-containing protein n=1 Tax=Nocardioides sp. SYSU DS0663 TaxID=3416445 RepID=UPI003F4BDBDF
MPPHDLPVPSTGDQLTLSVSREGDWAVVQARGEIDLATVGAFRTALQDLMVEGAVQVAVDLSGVSFIDSSALGALVAAHRRARGLGGSLAIAGPQPPVARILELTGLDRVLRTHPTVRAVVEG